MDYSTRLKNLKKALDSKLDAILLYGTDVEYFSGVPRETEPYMVWDLESNPVIFAWDTLQAEKFTDHEVQKILNLKKSIRAIDGKIGINKLNLKKPSTRFKAVDIGEYVRKIRTVKDGDEIRIMRKAAKLTARGFELVNEILEPGVTEKEIAASILGLFWLDGDGPSFEPIVASGKNSLYIHVRPSNKKVRRGESVIIDIGARIGGYQSDFTRTFLVDPTKKQLELVEMVIDAWELAKKSARPGMNVSELYRVVKDDLGDYSKYWPYALGHGVGLDVHEYPIIREKSNAKFAEGMVFALEPGLHVPGIGGVRFEDTGILTKRGFKPFI